MHKVIVYQLDRSGRINISTEIENVKSAKVEGPFYVVRHRHAGVLMSARFAIHQIAKISEFHGCPPARS